MKGGSVYRWCGCRDCFDIVVGTVRAQTLCGLCEDAGCEIEEGDCQREDAYDTSRGTDHGDD